MMAGIMAFNYVALAVYGRMSYGESCLVPSLKSVDWNGLRQLFGFAGWTVYSMGCIISRTQGVAIILNKFFGALINTAYGIGMQVLGATQYVSQALLNAMAPLIVKAEGRGDRSSMFHLSELTSKYSFFLLSLVVIPLMLEMPAVLHAWLGEVPRHLAFICRCLLAASLCDQLTVGLGVANQAIGRIRNYSLLINTMKMATLPLVYLCLWRGFSLEVAMYCYVLVELICAVTRLPFLHFTAGLSVSHYIAHVFMRIVLPLLLMFLAGFAVILYVDIPYRFLLTAVACIAVGLIAILTIGIEKDEREMLFALLSNRFTKRKEMDVI